MLEKIKVRSHNAHAGNANCHNLDAGQTMVGATIPPQLCQAMIRFASVFAVVFAAVLGGMPALAQDSSELVTRIERLEGTIRTLTGTIEELQYRNQQLEQQVQRLGAGTPPAAAAPQRPAAQLPPPTVNAPPQHQAAQLPPPAAVPPPVAAAAPAPSPPPVEPPPITGMRRSDAFDPAASPNAPGAPRQLGTSTAATEPPPPISDATASGGRQLGAPLDLSRPPGELPPPPPANPSATGAMQATLPPSNSPRDAYDLAYGYVLHKDYALAADTFRGFLRQYPSDRLAPEAQYWLGESLFQQQQYRDAAESFLAVSTKYETTARAPEALLRLGQSLAALGEKEAACASLGEVLRKYPHVSAGIKQAVDREQKRGHC
jgi:tol-pal system protein YbgF